MVSSIAKAGFGLGAIGVIAVLAVSIVTLVKVYNKDDKVSTVNNYPPGGDSNGTIIYYNETVIYNNSIIYNGSDPSAALNIPTNPLSDTAKYKQAANFFANSIDVSVSPCDDFYKYACGKYNQSISFDIAEIDNFLKMANSLNTPNANDPLPLVQIKKMYQKCLIDVPNMPSITADGSLIKAVLSDYKTKTNLPFPLLDRTQSMPYPNSTQLSLVLGYLSGKYSVDTLVSQYVDTNWKDPQGTQPYLLFLDQPVLSYQWTYYVGKTWDIVRPHLVSRVNQTFFNYNALLNGTKLDLGILDVMVNNIVDFEHLLANEYSSDATTRWQNDRSYNLIRVKDFNKNFTSFDIMTFMKNIAVNVIDDRVINRILKDPNYEISIAEPGMLQKLNNATTNNFGGKATAVTFANYIYYRLLDANRNLFPVGLSIDKNELLDRFQFKKPTRGKPRFDKDIRTRVAKNARDESEGLKINCVADTIDYFQYANARIFIDVIYPDATSRANIKNSVGHIVDSILVNMQGMIDQLSWMSADSKKGAYSKIQNLVRNIAYPDWIADNGNLTRYYSGIPADFTNPNTTYLDMLNYLNVFNTQLAFNQLRRTRGTDRADWNGPPGIVNAWYQPELNSISFPAAILRQPFFDQDWPASVNYGAMGVVAGHELSHGFDSSGTQWNGFGQLLGWLDPNSQQYFNDMTQCVINEYNNFCPISPANYTPNCINGQQTVGENVADNGGIHAAFRAYRNALNFFGPDPRLPGDLVSLLTHDQLFFLSFAQVWCQLPDDPDTTYTQLLVDPHSPSKYRVFGTIQNFPAFRTAFNCQPDSASAPKNHCNVWISDVNISQEEASSNVLNIPEAPAIKADDNLYTKYSQAQAFFKAALNLSADPCQDFYNYACGSYNKPVSFYVYRDRNYEIMASKIEDIITPGYPGDMKDSTAIAKLASFYKKCKIATADLNNLPEIKNGSVVKKVMDDFKDLTGYKFNLCDTNTQNDNNDPTVLAKALAYLSVKFGVNTFVTPFVDVNAQRNNAFAANFTLYLDQSTLTYDKSYYQDQAFASYTKQKLTENAKMLIQNYVNSVPGMTCKPNALDTIVNNIVNLEQQLGTTYSTDDTTRRNFSRWINPMEVNEVNQNYNFTDWSTFVSSLANYTDVPFVDDSTVDSYLLLVAEPDMMAAMSDYLQKNVGIDGVVKYLYYRLLLSQQQFVYVPPTNKTYTPVYHESGFAIGQKTRKRDPYAAKVTITDTMKSCAEATQDYMQYANARVFTEALYKTEDSRQYIRNETFKLISAIRDSMQAMLDNLSWIKMDPQTQQGARDKIMDLQLNLAFPDFVMNDTYLDEYYDTLKIDDSLSYFEMLNRLQVFNQYQAYINLTSDYINRADFLGPPGTVNAWYQPELNSITIPEGILQQPYFDPDWPASLKFGAMGVIVGHELTHGFDDQGVQWDGTGVLNTWMSDKAQTEFSSMAECVVEEYNNFTAITDPAYSPNHINGAQTQGENIADNGGIHSGYLSYQRWVQLNGPDPRLPDRVYGQFSHDQLFFLGFAQAWCQAPPTDAAMYRQLLVDPHSPSKFRVFGTLQNFPAFRQAFNCPVGSAYAPQDHCSVWVPKN